MGSRGPISKDASQRVRRNKVVEQEIEGGEFDPVGPPLPTHFGPEGAKVRYTKSVRARYERWRRSPQGQHFLDSDWDRLRDVAPLWQALESNPTDVRLVAEIRATEKTLGATIEDRLRAHIKVGKRSDAPPVETAAPMKRFRVVG